MTSSSNTENQCVTDFTAFIDAFWNKVVLPAEGQSGCVFTTDDSKKVEFITLFNGKYAAMREHMLDQKSFLDRCKVAAIIIDCVLESGFAQPIDPEKTVAKEMLALDLGLEILLLLLNIKLKEVGKRPVDRIFLPDSNYSVNAYDYVLARSLRLDREMGRSVGLFELAGHMFLLEQITLLKNNIDPKKLREK